MHEVINMKLSYPLIAIALLLLPLSMTGFAADQEKPAEPAAPASTKHGGMMGNMSEEQQEQHLKAIQEQSLMMHDLSNQILAEKDPAKKEQLKKQQRDLMKAYHAAMMQHHPRPDMH
jgi:flagellar biosynthesis component FlhA